MWKFSNINNLVERSLFTCSGTWTSTCLGTWSHYLLNWRQGEIKTKSRRRWRWGLWAGGHLDTFFTRDLSADLLLLLPWHLPCDQVTINAFNDNHLQHQHHHQCFYVATNTTIFTSLSMILIAFPPVSNVIYPSSSSSSSSYKILTWRQEGAWMGAAWER